ncbi:hypothetical protein O6H91_01G040200 [Diphasiastrum complanatum]|uniref:Uncharacterized protein n=1 Tax=Diphasiastrum complanatum TaxID=34168 RepID=A0ACC2EQ55_DIPCM|nr:hypothetical protein O6H91_01G040200 [Diphasiastrum complanatum]
MGGVEQKWRGLSRWNSPLVQVVMIGFICFCCPAMFNVLTGLGGGGQRIPKVANNSLTALYATFAIFGLLGGEAYNLLGPRRCIFLGCSFYMLYVGSFLSYNHNEGFVVAAGALLGIGAGLLWAGQGAMLMSYPPAESKGRYISLFWVIFNLGGVLGGFIPFSLNYNDKAGSVNSGTYIAFMGIMFMGALISLTLSSPDNVIRDDGNKVSTVHYSNVFLEGCEILKLFRNKKLLLLAPAFIASNFYYTYEFNNINGMLFNVRTRGLNNVFYWGVQMLGSVVMGYILDHSSTKRRSRGLMGLGVMVALTMLGWGVALANQLRYSRQSRPELLDFKDSNLAYAGPLTLYILLGLLDSMYQTLFYWILGMLTCETATLSRFSGFYKALQSAGAAISWQIDEIKAPLLFELLITWILLMLGLALATIVVWKGEDVQEGKVEDGHENYSNKGDEECPS